MSVELLRSTALSDNSTTYGSLSNSSFQQSGEETFCSLEMAANSIPKATEASGNQQQQQTQTSCICVEKDITCQCGKDSLAKTNKTIKLEPWGKYKTVAMVALILLLVVWIAIFAPLKHKYNL